MGFGTDFKILKTCKNVKELTIFGNVDSSQILGEQSGYFDKKFFQISSIAYDFIPIRFPFRIQVLTGM
jgi:hypothetical protein